MKKLAKRIGDAIDNYANSVGPSDAGGPENSPLSLAATCMEAVGSMPASAIGRACRAIERNFGGKVAFAACIGPILTVVPYTLTVWTTASIVRKIDGVLFDGVLSED